MTNGISRRSSSETQGTEAAIQNQTNSTDVSTDVVVEVARAEGVDPMEMDERLHDWIDPDALEAVVGSMEYGHVEFTMAGHEVCVQSNGRVLVDR